MQITHKLRLRDKHIAGLNCQSLAVNYVWNYCNQTQRVAARSCRKWLLRERVWRCDDCGAEHDRDVNAARNILRLGQQTLGGGAHA